jgi:branched-chain amino acid transport system substrate-binding protein
VLMPISGAVGFLGEAGLAGTRAEFELANAQGGAKGRQFQLIVVDTQFEPSVEALGTKRLVDQDKVFMIVSVIGDSSAPYITSKGIPEVVAGGSPPAFSSHYPTIYPVCCNAVEDNAEWAWELTQVLKLPIKSTAILYDTQNIPIQQWLPYMVKAWEIWGVQVKSTDAFNVSDGDCTAVVLKIRSLNIDYWNLGQSVGWPLCGQALARQNYKPPLGFGGLYTPDAYYVAQAGPGVDGLYADNIGPQLQNPATFGQPYEWDPSGRAPQAQAFVDSMRKYSPHNADWRSLESLWAQTWWSGAKLFVEAIRAQTGAVTWQGVNSWIQSQRDWRSGLVPPMDFDPKCKSGGQWYAFQWHWDGTQFVQTDWHKYADPAKLQPDGQPWGHWHMPVDAKNKIIPGAGDCLATALADAVIHD